MTIGEALQNAINAMISEGGGDSGVTLDLIAVQSYFENWHPGLLEEKLPE